MQRNFDHTADDFTLERIIEYGFDQYAEGINEISGAATKELAIELVGALFNYSLTISLPHRKLLDFSVSREFTENRSSVFSYHCMCPSKDCGNRRKGWLPVFSTFPTMFLEVFLLRVVETKDCLLKD